MKRRSLIAMVLLGLLVVASSLAVPAGAQEGAEDNMLEGCVENYDPNVDYFPHKVTVEHAAGLEIEYFNNYKVVRVTTPWPGAEVAFEYVLVQCGTPAPEGFDGAQVQVIEVPIETIITMSTTYLPQLAELDALDALVGVDNITYINTPEVIEMFEAGDLVEVGEGASINVELVLDADPDIVMANGTGAPEWDAHPVLLDAGIPVALNSDYVETSPLGRAEWLKFTALFFNREAQANEVFGGIAARYGELTARAVDVEEKPTVFLNTPWGDSWYMAGGASYMAQLLADAGADYLWADDAATGGIPLDFETVFDVAAEADFWLNPGLWTSLDEGLTADERFGDFAAFQNGNVFNNNARMNANGFSDYFESGAARPDLVLADLIAVLHPDLMPDHELYYYQPLE